MVNRINEVYLVSWQRSKQALLRLTMHVLMIIISVFRVHCMHVLYRYAIVYIHDS